MHFNSYEAAERFREKYPELIARLRYGYMTEPDYKGQVVDRVDNIVYVNFGGTQ